MKFFNTMSRMKQTMLDFLTPPPPLMFAKPSESTRMIDNYKYEL